MDEKEKEARVRAIQRLLNDDSDKFVTQSEYDAIVKDNQPKAFQDAWRRAQLHAAIVSINRRGY